MVMDATQANNSSRNVTIRDVAEVAGVSVQIVSRALNGQTKGLRRDAAARAERVRQVAKRLNYRRDLAAVATRGRRFGSMALVLSSNDTRRSNLPPGLLNGLTEALDERDMHLSVARLSDEALTDHQRVPRLLRDVGADGLLVNYNQWVPPQMNRLIEAHGLPAVWLNEKRPNNAVYPDDYAGTHEATQRLLALGHRRIAYFGRTPADDAHYSETDRHNGYTDAMSDAGLGSICLGPIAGRGDAALLEVLRSEQRPTAVITYNAVRAALVLLLARDAGLRCPADLSVVTFSGSPVELVDRVATMRIPDEQVGREGVAMLVRRIEQSRDIPARCLALEWVEGQTVGRCPETIKESC